MYVEQGAKKSFLVMGQFFREEDEGVSSPYMERDK